MSTLILPMAWAASVWIRILGSFLDKRLLFRLLMVFEMSSIGCKNKQTKENNISSYNEQESCPLLANQFSGFATGWNLKQMSMHQTSPDISWDSNCFIKNSLIFKQILFVTVEPQYAKGQGAGKIFSLQQGFGYHDVLFQKFLHYRVQRKSFLQVAIRASWS